MIWDILAGLGALFAVASLIFRIILDRRDHQRKLKTSDSDKQAEVPRVLINWDLVQEATERQNRCPEDYCICAPFANDPRACSKATQIRCNKGHKAREKKLQELIDDGRKRRGTDR
jgi:hypothetical protein